MNLLIVLGELLVVAALIAVLMVVSPAPTLGAVAILGIPAALVYRSMQRRSRWGAQLSKTSPR